MLHVDREYRHQAAGGHGPFGILLRTFAEFFFLGQFAKIGLTAALVVWVARSFESVNWLAMLIGLIAALQVPIFALLLQRDVPGPGDDAAGTPGEGLPEDAAAGGRR